MPTQETPKHSREGLAQSLVESLLLYLGVHKVFLCPPSISASLSPVEVLYSNLDDLQSHILWGFPVSFQISR